jgi:6-hydroxytryprostatin B O-methyltransferase
LPFEAATLRALNRFNIPEAVPLDEEASFAAIAAATGLDRDFLTRIIRHACTRRIFCEHRPGYVIHTAGSRALLENRALRDFMTTCLGVGFQSAACMDDAVEKYGDVSDGNRSALNLAFGVEENMFTFLQRPEQAWRLKALNG